jgi:hypothetical protein
MADEIRLTTLKPSHAGLGLVFNYLSKRKPFADHTAGALAAAIRVQLETQNNLLALQGEVIVGYAGWMDVTKENADSWLKGESQLVQVASGKTEVAALTIFVADLSGVTPKLIRGARDLNPNISVVFRRGYEQSDKAAKKQSVGNIAPSS